MQMGGDDTNERIQSLTRELDLMRERYSKLADVHGQLQKDNSLLEERILSLVETYSAEKNQLEQGLLDAKQKVFHLQETVEDLEVEKQRYKDDCNLAVRLLHRHPQDFISTNTSEHIPEHLKTKTESVRAAIHTFLREDANRYLSDTNTISAYYPYANISANIRHLASIA
jgi:chromosome segregation ATPase